MREESASGVISVALAYRSRNSERLRRLRLDLIRDFSFCRGSLRRRSRRSSLSKTLLREDTESAAVSNLKPQRICRFAEGRNQTAVWVTRRYRERRAACIRRSFSDAMD